MRGLSTKFFFYTIVTSKLVDKWGISLFCHIQMHFLCLGYLTFLESKYNLEKWSIYPASSAKWAVFDVLCFIQGLPSIIKKNCFSQNIRRHLVPLTASGPLHMHPCIYNIFLLWIINTMYIFQEPQQHLPIRTALYFWTRKLKTASPHLERGRKWSIILISMTTWLLTTWNKVSFVDQQALQTMPKYFCGAGDLWL